MKRYLLGVCAIRWAKYFGLLALLVAPLFATEAFAQTGTWTHCANEGEICNLPGNGQVRYGANGVYATQSASNSIECSNATFGDPTPGVVKACDYLIGSPPPPPGVAPLSWDDPAVRFWVRADKTNQEIGDRFKAPDQPYAWIGVQGSGRTAESCNYEVIEQLPEPNTNIDPATGQPRTVLRRADGYFEHRIWEGMCLWTGNGNDGQRLRSAIHTADGYDHPSSAKYGRSYWFAFGGKFHADMFSQIDPSGDRAINFMDFHHAAPSSALSGNSPWSCSADHTGYECAVKWNANQTNPPIYSPTGEINPGDGLAQMVTLVRDTSKDTTQPHFFAFRFKLDWDNTAWVESYRQIGIDGPITMIGRWEVPTSYSGSNNVLFPKYGLHQWYSDLSGEPTRSIDMAGALLVEDVTLSPEVIFKSLTVALPRSGGSGGYPAPHNPESEVPVPNTSPAPTLLTTTLTSLNANEWLINIGEPTSNFRINVFTQTNADPNFPYQDQEFLGSLPAGTTQFRVPKQSGKWLRIGGQNSSGYGDDGKSAPLALAPAPYQPESEIAVPDASPAPTLLTTSLTSLSASEWLVNIGEPTSAFRINTFTQTSSDPDFPYQDQEFLGSLPAGTTQFRVAKQAGKWLRIGGQNSSGYGNDGKSAPLSLAP